MGLFFKKKKSESHNLKGRVHCNEGCVLQPVGSEAKFSCRLRELNWLGVIVDNVDDDCSQYIKTKEGGCTELTIGFKIPREFGRVEVCSGNYLVSRYHDVVSGTDKLKLDFNLESSDGIEIIREFVNYRNRRFSRHLSKRRSRKILREEVILTWLVYIPVGILSAFALFAYIRNTYFPSAEY